MGSDMRWFRPTCPVSGDLKEWIDKNVHELIVAKQRNGPTDTVYLRFINDITRFESAAPDSYAM